MVGPAVDLLDHLGPLKNSKNADFDDSAVYAAPAFDFDRFRRHLAALLERICRMAAGSAVPDTVDDLSEYAENDMGVDEPSEWTNEVTTAAFVEFNN